MRQGWGLEVAWGYGRYSRGRQGWAGVKGREADTGLGGRLQRALGVLKHRSLSWLPWGPSPRKTSLSCCLAPCSLQLCGRDGLSAFYEWHDWATETVTSQVSGMAGIWILAALGFCIQALNHYTDVSKLESPSASPDCWAPLPERLISEAWVELDNPHF